MARRANSKIRPLWIVLALGALIAAIAVGVVVQSTGGEPYRTVPELDMAEYLNNANSLQGNVYKVRGSIAQALGYSRDKGRLFSVEVSGENGGGNGNGNGNNLGGDNSGGAVLPILVPPSLSYLNLQKGQRYIFRLEVGDGGILKAQDMKKTSS